MIFKSKADRICFMKKFILTIPLILLLSFQYAHASTCIESLSGNPSQSSFSFSNLDLNQLERDLDKAKTDTLEAFDTIANNSAAPTFENTIVEFLKISEFGHEAVMKAYTLFYNDKSKKVEELVSKIQENEVSFSKKRMNSTAFFNRINEISKNMDQLSDEEKAIVLDIRDYLAKSGLNLDPADKEQLVELTSRKSKLIEKFQSNLSSAQKEFQFEFTDTRYLSGLPNSFINQIKQIDKKTRKISYKLNASYPHYVNVLKYADSEIFRKRFSLARSEIATKGTNENRSVILELMKVKKEIALLLGFNSSAEQNLKAKMAKDKETVYSFLHQRAQDNKELAIAEKEELQSFKNSKTGNSNLLQPWDVMYWSEKLKSEKFNFSESDIKPYLSLESTIQGMFLVANKLYGISVKEVSHIDSYSDEVKVYEIKDSEGKILAHMHADYFSRDGVKKSGAWAMPLQSHTYKDGVRQPYAVSISTNFMKSDKNLLTISEAETLFHEFGHALHGILSETKYTYFSGTSVKRDFVELPSQIMELYMWEKESLDLFAKHHETGETIPQELYEKMVSTKNFRKGNLALGQTRLALLDMSWHDTEAFPTSSDFDSLLAFERNSALPVSIDAIPTTTIKSVGFSHILEGYSAGYYGYAWADVLAEDAFQAFKETGNIFNPEVAARFRALLAAGGSVDPLKLYTEFRGQEPSFVSDKN